MNPIREAKSAQGVRQPNPKQNDGMCTYPHCHTLALPESSVGHDPVLEALDCVDEAEIRWLACKRVIDDDETAFGRRRQSAYQKTNWNLTHLPETEVTT